MTGVQTCALPIYKQSELFDTCKQVNKNSALDKNISMLVLWETGGDLDIGEMKKKIMMVEEDPYFFKKHVLYFSSEEYDSLKTALGKESLHNFLQKNIALQDVFVKYKENPLSQGWRPLLYRIAIKIPFIDIDIGSSDGLTSLFEKNSLASKTLSSNAYQKMYRQIISEKEFDSLQRQHFQPVALNWPFPIENQVMKWKSELSSKYSQQQAIESIKNRFKNSHECIHLTLDKHKTNSDFQKFINELRTKGFHDWQIVLALMNYILNYKAQLKLRESGAKFKSDEEYVEALQKTFDKYLHMDEKDFYVDFPLDAFKTADFELQLKNLSVNVLRAAGLENKSRFPNFDAIKEFLDIRFNMKIDSTDIGNPLKDIVRE